MKINQLGTFGMLGVVVSLTAACSGSPIKPAALNPAAGDGSSARAAIALSDARLIGAGLEPCPNQPPAAVDQYGEVLETTDTVLMCDVSTTEEPAAAEEPAAEEVQSDVIISDTSTVEALRGVSKFNH
jgi:hypothetical protein